MAGRWPTPTSVLALSPSGRVVLSAAQVLHALLQNLAEAVVTYIKYQVGSIKIDFK